MLLEPPTVLRQTPDRTVGNPAPSSLELARLLWLPPAPRPTPVMRRLVLPVAQFFEFGLCDYGMRNLRLLFFWSAKGMKTVSIPLVGPN